ncbi:MAG: glycosyltransferase family 1 protein [bacterium]
MKILIITDTLVSKIDGVSTSIDQTTKFLRKNGHEVKVIHHGLFHSFSLAPYFPELLFSFFPGKKLKHEIIKEKPDYIHITTEGTLGLKARMICIKNNIKFTTSYHTHYDLYLKERVNNFFYKITKSYLLWFHKKSEAVMVSTDSLKKELASKGYKNLVICPLGVDINLFKKSTSVFSNYSKPIFTYLGRLAKEKNVEEFLKCTLPGTKLIIGDGPERKQLESKYKDSANFLGIKRGQELVNLLSQSDVLVFPSRTDTFGLVIVEALACNVPVAGHDVMGPRDIISHGVDGFLDEDLSKAALECLKLNKEVCREKAKTFSWENSANIFLQKLIKNE